MARQRPESKSPRWMLVGALVGLLALADWYAGGVGPRFVLGTATLNLTSDPDAARVFLDGKSVGRTPLSKHHVRPGKTVVRMEHRFHGAVARSVTPIGGGVVDIHVEFPPSEGSLEVVTNPRGATILIDGRKFDDVTPVLLGSHPTGAFEVTASIHGRQTKTETVEVLPRENTEVSFDLERVPMSKIYVSRWPRDAELAIDGKPYEPGMTLRVGTYRLRAQRSGYAPMERTVEANRGRSDHTIKLMRLAGTLSVQVSPPSATVEVTYPEAGDWRAVPYKEGMRIPTGPVIVRARAMGYRSRALRLTMGAKPSRHVIHLQPYRVEPGRRFKDGLASGGEGPLMVVIGPGSFRMGSEDGAMDERPVRTVHVAQPFAIGVYETTRDDYDRLRRARGLLEAVAQPPVPEGVTAESLARLPMTGVSWEAAQAYAEWLGGETGHRYRLPSEAEWEYVAGAGSAEPYHFGSDPEELCGYANIADAVFRERYNKPGTANCSDGALRLARVGSFAASAFGVHDILGNVEEWVADCWHDNHRGAPSDQQARSGRCGSHVLRGGAWDSPPDEATVSYRSFSSRGSGTRGVRVVREL